MKLKLLLTLIVMMSIVGLVNATWDTGLNPELLSYYKLNNTGNDSFNSNNELIQAGNVYFRPDGKIGEALNGTDLLTDFYTIPAQAHGGDVGTMNFWFYRATGGVVIIMADSTLNNNGDLYVNAGTINWQSNIGGSPNTITSDGTVPLNTWTMVTILWNSSGTDFYFDGTYDSTKAWRKFYSTSDLMIGRDQGTNSVDLYFDELSFWNSTLSADQINTLYNSGNGRTYEQIGPVKSLNVTLLSPLSNTNKSEIGFYYNLSAILTGLQNSTLYVYNSTSLVNKTFNDTISLDTTINVSIILPDGYYTWFADVWDNTSTIHQVSNNVSFGIDFNYPTIDYGTGIYMDYSNVSSSNIFINVTNISPNVQNITYRLYTEPLTSCYQESTNTSNQSGTDTQGCGLQYTGLYEFNLASPIDLYRFYDGDWTYNLSSIPFVYGLSGDTITINYTKPTLAIYNATWRVRVGKSPTETYFNNLIPTHCLNTYTDTVSLRIEYVTGFPGDRYNYQCRNVTDWNNIMVLFNGIRPEYDNITEESIIWGMANNSNVLNITTYPTTKTELTWFGLPNGRYYYDSYVTSFTGKINITSFKTIILDTTPPNVTIITPPDSSYTTDNDINFSYNVTDSGFNNISNQQILGTGVINTTLWVFNMSGGLVNKTTTTILGNIFSFIINIPMTLINGIYNWFVEATDYAFNTVTTSNSTVTIDNDSPILTIISPTNTTYVEGFVMSSNTSMNISWNVIDELSSVSSCWYYFDNIPRTDVPCYENITYRGINYSQHNLTFFANDTLGNEVNKTVIATWKYIMITNSINYNPITYELASELFIFNTTLDPSITGATMILNYNNTNYISDIISSGPNTLFRNIITTPPVNQPTNVSFNWNFTASDGVYTYNIISQSYNQTINPILVGLCNATLTNMIYNFTAIDEVTLLRIKPFYFGGTFGYSINGTLKKEVTIAKIADEVNICDNLPSSPINLNVYVTYDEDENITQIYNTRNFVLQNHLKYSNTDQINLSLLNQTRSTQFTLKVQDNDLVPLANYVINTYRLDSSTGTFYLTQSGKTDSNGLTNGFFEINTVDYYFVITYQDEVKLITSPPQKVIPQISPYTLVFTINAGGISPLSSLINVTDLNLTMTNTATGMSMNYRDSSTNFTNARFLVYRMNYSGQNILVCNITSPLVTDTLSCNFNGINGTYTGIAYLTRNTKEFFVRSMNSIFPNDGRGWGLFGVFLGMLIILCCSFMFRYNEIAGIWLITLAIIFINIIGFINFGIPFITAIIAIAIILTVVMKQ